ncbi:hypothetical protein HW132_08175 [Brasilonema sp. CT11]|nr:hypothetical protein [Brasilonema sp. CT11]
MNHPFGLDVSDLEAIELNFEEELNDEEAAQVLGGSSKVTTKAGEQGEGEILTTLALGEEGGIQCISAPCPGSEGGEKPPTKPRVSKGWFFESGGHFPW